MPNKSMSTLLLPAIPIILGVLIASAATLIAKVTLTDNELIYGVFKRKQILLSDLQKAAITNPPCVYRKNKRAVVYINASQKIEISYDTYYGSQDFIQLLGKALRTNIQYNDVKREVSATTRIIGLSVAAYAIVVLIYMLSLLSNSTFYSSIFDAAAPSAPTRELVIFQGQDITNERLKEMVDNEEIPADVENLNLAYNQISNVTALQSLINLQDLDLYDSEI